MGINSHKAMLRIADGVQDKHIRHLSVFAVARIPLLMYLGYVLDDKTPTDLYQKHRVPKESWLWPDDEPPVQFETVLFHAGKEGTSTNTDLVVMLSISGTITLDELPAEVRNYPIFVIYPVNVTPNPNLLRSEETLKRFQRTWQDMLASLETTHKQAKNIHLFPAVPVTAAISCGRLIMRHVHPTLRIYDRVGSGSQFHYALSLNGEE